MTEQTQVKQTPGTKTKRKVKQTQLVAKQNELTPQQKALDHSRQNKLNSANLITFVTAKRKRKLTAQRV